MAFSNEYEYDMTLEGKDVGSNFSDGQKGFLLIRELRQDRRM